MEVSLLSTLTPTAVEAVRRIYLEAFPPSERIPFSELVHPPPDEDRDVYVLSDPPRVHGLASVFRLKGFPAVLLEFLAVEQARRGGGLGGLLWRHVRRTVAVLPEAAGLILEVEDPDEVGVGVAEAGLRRRRIRFYEHGGAFPLPVTGYRVPSRLGGHDLPMLLLWAPSGQALPLPRPQLEDLVNAVHAESYGVVDSAFGIRDVTASGALPRKWWAP